MSRGSKPLRVHMERANTKPGQLARAAGISEAPIYQVLRGEKVSRNDAVRMCNALGVILSEVTEFENFEEFKVR